MRCVWVQFLNYLLSLIMPVQTLHLMSSLGFELHALAVTWETDDISLLTQCLGFFTPRSHGKTSGYLFGGMRFKATWSAAAFRWKEGKKIK